ncbi:molybdenum cofactor guanylyltransferase [Streptosporangium lutulentum]|uniref:Molybdopterin-guanine dinucleotide biosynthesis protein A n=1 Tax=Streptosporangium lutulentum TaxID=1461250 RepID=A0ABT9QCQ9_9ACTN|nr:NTP transferase domain-containing protein [Streptosporangium lutulentum]MDP9844555.1 molybdopterin-guanine dinucleotide biosynthesis protein A [Streptosporangium lutulentum]
MSSRYDACVLAGGRASRLGGQDKPALRVLGRSLIETVAAAVADAERLIVVGPIRPGLPHAIFRREDPPGGGPVPALRAGLAEVSAPWVALLAADLPFLTAEHVSALLEAAGGGGPGDGGPGGDPVEAATGAVLVDDDGREQWLAGVWRTASLVRALAGYEERSLHGLLAPLSPVKLHLTGEPWFDCDTLDDLRRARDGEPGSRAEVRALSEGREKRRERETIATADEE